MDIGKNVRIHRTLNGLTQAQLGDMTGVSERMIKFIEKGQKAPSLFLTMEMAKVFGCSLDEITGFKQKGKLR